MDCVCRNYHDECVDDCPQCCPTGDTGARVLTHEQVRATAYSELSYIGIDGSALIAKAIAAKLFGAEGDRRG